MSERSERAKGYSGLDRVRVRTVAPAASAAGNTSAVAHTASAAGSASAVAHTASAAGSASAVAHAASAAGSASAVAGAGSRGTADGARALFSPVESRPPMGAVTIGCARCEQTSVLTVPRAARAMLPSVHLPLRRRHRSWLRCPACRRLSWVSIRFRP